MSHDGTASTPTAHRPGRARGAVAVLLAILAVVASVLALMSVWTFRTLNSTDLFVNRVGVIIENPAVAQEIGDKAATQLVSAIDVEEKLAEVLPPKAAKAIATPVASGMERYLSEATTSLIGTERFQQAWEKSLAVSHTLAIDLLSGKSTDSVSTSNGEIVVNLVPLMNALLAEAAQPVGDLLNRTITPPDLTAQNIDQAVAELNKALGTDLPPDFGTITVAQSQNLATMQSAYRAIKTIVWLAPIAALVLIGLAVAAARRRLRALLWIVVGTALTLFLVGLLTAPIKTALLNALPDQSLSNAVGQAYTTVLSSLMTGITVAVVIGIIAALGLFLSGDSKAATASRDAAARTPALATRHRGAFLVGGAVVALVVLAVLPTKGWAEFAFMGVLYAAFALAVLLSSRFDGAEQEQVSS